MPRTKHAAAGRVRQRERVLDLAGSGAARDDGEVPGELGRRCSGIGDVADVASIVCVVVTVLRAV